ncbi:MAG: PEP-CTERM sorting domain-containing protein [Caulobacteraceae bacterium]
MSKRLMAACVAAAALLAAGEASATVYNLTYSGHVTQAFDSTLADGPSFLGAASALAGQAFTAHVVFNNAVPGQGHSSNAFTDTIYGPGVATADITLAGHTFTLGSTTGLDERTDYRLDPTCTLNCNQGSWLVEASNETVDPSGLHTLQYINLFAGGVQVSGLGHATAPDYTNPPVDIGAFMALFQQNQGGGPQDTLYDTEVSVHIDSITGGDRWVPAGGVPEPGVWAMMLVGFGGLGAVMRGRRRTGLTA